MSPLATTSARGATGRRRSATASRPRGRHPRRHARRGVSIVELLVAIVVLVVGVIGLAATASMVVRQMGGGAQLTVTASVAQARFERLTAAACPTLLATPAGSGTTRGVVERWRVADAGNGTLEMIDSLTYPTARGPRTVAYQSLRAC